MAAVDGAEGARLRRLVASGWRCDRCALLGIELDVGPRASRWQTPERLGDEVMSTLGLAILDSDVHPKALRFAATRLVARSKI
jgi:hypothetical protein